MSKVLVTGAFGNLGQMVIDELRGQGFTPVAADLDDARSRRIAKRYGLEQTAHWDDVRRQDFDAVLSGVTAVIHLAAVLPPVTDREPALARAINVEATMRLIDSMERSAPRAVLIYPSSVTVYGLPVDPGHLHRSDDPTRPTDNYSSHKVEVENRLKKSDIPWAILRVGVAVDSRTLGADAATMRTLFNIDADNPLEYVHPRDVALAMVNAIRRPEAHRKILLIGGGERCRVTQHRFLSAGLGALGLELPRELLGRSAYYTCWMDTTESQALLGFQRHSFSDYETEMRHRLRWIRVALTPLRPVARWALRRALRR